MAHKWKWNMKLPHNMEECTRLGCKAQRKVAGGKRKSDQYTYRVGDGEWMSGAPECSKEVTT